MKLESWRLFFPLACVAATAALSAWAAQLGGCSLGLTPAAHAGLMIHGVLGTGVLGFAMTAYPKQNEAPLPGPLTLWIFAGLQLLGTAGWFLGVPFAAITWLAATIWAGRIALPSLRRKRDATTATVPIALFGGFIATLLPFPLSSDVAAGPFLPLLALAAGPVDAGRARARRPAAGARARGRRRHRARLHRGAGASHRRQRRRAAGVPPGQRDAARDGLPGVARALRAGLRTHDGVMPGREDAGISRKPDAILYDWPLWVRSRT